jgi:hypothetical protein
MTDQDQYVLEIEWDRPSPDSPKLPSLVGPFISREQAWEWASLNIPNGSSECRPLAFPFARPAFTIEVV